MMRDAVKKGNANGSELALLEDRIAIGKGQKQIYGSQLYQDKKNGKYLLSPIEDEINVNKRRASVGLGSIEEYVKHWGIIYKIATPKVDGNFRKPVFKNPFFYIFVILTVSIVSFVLKRKRSFNRN